MYSGPVHVDGELASDIHQKRCGMETTSQTDGRRPAEEEHLVTRYPSLACVDPNMLSQVIGAFGWVTNAKT